MTAYARCYQSVLVYTQVKLSGVMDNCSVFDQLATVREVDLYGLWMPFVAASTLVAQIGRVELLDYFEVSMNTVYAYCIRAASMTCCIPVVLYATISALRIRRLMLAITQYCRHSIVHTAALCQVPCCMRIVFILC
jgi:hypothetical protein